jgi:prophage regulatory protein
MPTEVAKKCLETPTVGKRIIPIKMVMAKTSKSRTSLWRSVKDRSFFPPVRISVGRVGWLEEVVDAWIDARVAEAAE